MPISLMAQLAADVRVHGVLVFDSQPPYPISKTLFVQTSNN